MFVYDVSIENSLKNIKQWVNEFKTKNTNINNIIMIVANKSDLIKKQDTLEVKSYCTVNNYLFVETSALENYNVELAFNVLIMEIYHSGFYSGFLSRMETTNLILKPKKSIVNYNLPKVLVRAKSLIGTLMVKNSKTPKSNTDLIVDSIILKKPKSLQVISLSNTSKSLHRSKSINF